MDLLLQVSEQQRLILLVWYALGLWWSCILKCKFACCEIRAAHGDGAAITGSSLGPYLLWPRQWLWIKQAAFASLIAVDCSQLFTHVLPGTDPPDAVETVRMVSSMFMLVVALSGDGLNIIADLAAKRQWLLLYIFMSPAYVWYAFTGPVVHTWQSLMLPVVELFVYCTGLLFALLAAIGQVPRMQSKLPTEEFLCGIWSYFTFSYLNEILIKPAMKKECLEFEDLPRLSEDDSSEFVWSKFSFIWSQKKSSSLTMKLFSLVWYEFLCQGFFQFLSSNSLLVSPIALQTVVWYIDKGHSGSSSHTPFGIPISLAVFMLFLGSVMKSIGDNQNYMRGRHIGIRVKSSLISAVYAKSLSVDVAEYRDGVGKINNLISVDVGMVQDLCCYLQLLWSTLYEMIICCIMLYTVLGNAAWFGLLMMGSSILIGGYFGKYMEQYQDDMLTNKDKRMSVVTEVLNGIKVIKLFGLEDGFYKKIANARQIEVGSLRSYLLTRAGLNTVWGIVPTVVAATAFIVHVKFYNKTLTPAVGFASLTLFNLIRFPLTVFPDMINFAVRARISLLRIEAFLSTADVQGLSCQSLAVSNEPISGGQVVLKISNALFGWKSTPRESDMKDDYVGVLPLKLGMVDMCHSCFQKIGSSFGITRRKVSAGGVISTSSYKALSSNDEGSVHGLVSGHSVDSTELYEQSDDRKDSSISGVQLLPLEQCSKGTVDVNSGDIESGGTTNQPLAYVIYVDSIQIKAGSLNVIVGLTGSGKSTLLSGILGENHKLAGESLIEGSISYVPQKAWIQNATIRDNILMGLPYDAERYAKVIFSCALVTDIEMFAEGDLTEIGEKGANLSGGQQQRVSLARAAYAKSSIIIMDDPLSAVDAHVGEHIFKHLVKGLLSDRTRLLVTHQIAVAVPAADQLIFTSQTGKLVLTSHPTNLQRLVEDVSSSSPLLSSDDVGYLKSITTVILEAQNTRTAFGGNVPRTAASSPSTSPGRAIREANHIPAGTQLVKKEEKNRGSVPWSVYWFYLKATGGGLAVFSVLSCSIALAVATVLQSYYLGLWMMDLQARRQLGANDPFTEYIVCGVIVVATTLLRSLLQALLGLRAAQILHGRLASRILKASMGWFDRTPIGRIINRFSEDISQTDSDLMGNLMWFLDCLMGAIQIFVVIFASIPICMAPLLPVIGFTCWISMQYLRVSRDIKRLESVNKSPVFVHFSETLQGLSVIRAFRQELNFLQTCFARIDAMNRCHLYLWHCNRWLNFRMQMMGGCVAGITGLAIVLMSGRMSSTAAGLALVYSLNFTEYLTFLARSHADCQMNLNCVERIKEYSMVPIEEYFPAAPSSSTTAISSETDDSAASSIAGPCVTPTEELAGVPRSWPNRGIVEFRRICSKYESSDSLVLKNVSFTIPAGTKVGIVGRTGAGKSSLVNLLYRIIEPVSGQVIIDGVDIFSIPLNTLRSRISIVPQDSILFEGSIRTNLDPFTELPDEELWQVLSQTCQADFVNSMSGATLQDKMLADKGGNLSAGQRQLLCLARAMLRKNTILVLDECTASVDYETDALIQSTVRQHLSNVTVLCIAHRLHTIAFYDMILVLEKGEVVESGRPLDLMNDRNSKFYDMCMCSGDFSSLYAMASGSSDVRIP